MLAKPDHQINGGGSIRVKHTGRPDTAGAGVSAGGDVLGGSTVAVALTGRAGTARAPRSGDGVLGGSLVARAVKGGLLATTAGCLSG